MNVACPVRYEKIVLMCIERIHTCIYYTESPIVYGLRPNMTISESVKAKLSADMLYKKATAMDLTHMPKLSGHLH